MDFNTYQKLALSLPNTVEVPHFEKPSFRYKNKIFGTYWPEQNLAMLKLSLIDQSVYHSYAPEIFFPVQGAWGKQGATLVNIELVAVDVFQEALIKAYMNIGGKFQG